MTDLRVYFLRESKVWPVRRDVDTAGGEATAALGLGPLLLQQGARAEGSQMLQEAANAARRMGPRGADLARRADQMLVSAGLPEPEAASTRAARSRRPREEPRRTEADGEASPEESSSEPPPETGRDSVFRETTLPPL
jgi:hypothetical protein